MDCSPQCSSVHGILQASILEWFVISFSRGYSRPRDGTQVSCLSCIASEFFTTDPPGKPQVTPYANSGPAFTVIGYARTRGSHSGHGLPLLWAFLNNFFPPLFTVPPSWTPLLLFLFFPNHLTELTYLLYKLKYIFFKRMQDFPGAPREAH